MIHHKFRVSFKYNTFYRRDVCFRKSNRTQPESCTEEQSKRFIAMTQLMRLKPRSLVRCPAVIPLHSCSLHKFAVRILIWECCTVLWEGTDI